MNQWCLVYWRIYASLGLMELTHFFLGDLDVILKCYFQSSLTPWYLHIFLWQGLGGGVGGGGEGQWPLSDWKGGRWVDILQIWFFFKLQYCISPLYHIVLKQSYLIFFFSGGVGCGVGVGVVGGVGWGVGGGGWGWWWGGWGGGWWVVVVGGGGGGGGGGYTWCACL